MGGRQIIISNIIRKNVEEQKLKILEKANELINDDKNLDILEEEFEKKYLKQCGLLSIWFTVSFGFGILLVDELNQIKIAGFKLGFWFAQQGSIYVFVLLIFVYIYLMNRLDKKYNLN